MTTSWLIPAWAGKTSACRGFRGAAAGSSPRGRGKHPVRRSWDGLSRLIPAWAGKTSTVTGMKRSNRAHPRVGGENQDENIVNLSKQGSSPRGRGKR